MKSLVKKKETKVKTQNTETTERTKTAQCCAKISSKVAGCHD